MTSGDKFLVSQVARILQMSEAVLKDWTNGRRLRIGPQRSAVGRGFPNLYGTSDIYKLAIARQLTIDGFTPRAIQKIVDNLGAEFASADVAVVSNHDRQFPARSKRSSMHVRLMHESDGGHDLWSAISEQIRTSVGCHVLHVAGITEDVNRRVDMFLHKAFGGKNRNQRELHSQTDGDVDVNRETSGPIRKFRKSPEKKGE